ncbi:hypothetical protein [Halobellus inordinatus]|uniref:hypothetical protein n=1 Tax=Halobellus inordinatus TaxID=1126236 RepID=UPI002115AE57|nr:hypothetical protein [Halobellus ramosii]
MAVKQRLQFVHATVAWTLGVILILALLESISYELVFVTSLIGFLVITELTAPFSISPAWRRRLLYIIGLGLVGFGYIVIRRILEILPPGVF